VALIQPTNPEFRASDGWLQKFMTLNSLSLRRHTSIQQKLPGDLEKKLEEFMSSVQALRKRHDFPSNLIINMDETPIFFDTQGERTVNKKGVREVRVRGTTGGKKCVTFVVACASDGKMLKPMVIVKGKTSKSIKNIQYSSKEVCVAHQNNAWMDNRLMCTWIKEVLVKYTKHKHCLLVFDSFRGHLMEDVSTALNKANVTTVVIPGGCTSKVQPIDVCLHRPIKDMVRGQWEEYMLQATAQSSSMSIPSPSKTDIVNWIVQANSMLNTRDDCVRQSFKVCGISNLLDGSENGIIRCVKELPNFDIPYGSAAHSSEEEGDIFASDGDGDTDDSEGDSTES
jgi:hypothetical protein